MLWLRSGQPGIFLKTMHTLDLQCHTEPPKGAQSMDQPVVANMQQPLSGSYHRKRYSPLRITFWHSKLPGQSRSWYWTVYQTRGVKPVQVKSPTTRYSCNNQPTKTCGHDNIPY